MNIFLLVLCSGLLYRLWTAWLYPKYLSPLKHLPQLKVRSRLVLETTGERGLDLIHSNLPGRRRRLRRIPYAAGANK